MRKIHRTIRCLTGAIDMILQDTTQRIMRVTFLQDSMPQIIMYQMVRSADTIRLDDALLKAAKISNFRFSTLARIRRIF